MNDRKRVKERIAFEFDDIAACSNLDEFIRLVKERFAHIPENEYRHVKFIWGYDAYEPELWDDVIWHRLETDEEMHSRIEFERKHIERMKIKAQKDAREREAKERALLAKLKGKYGD